MLSVNLLILRLAALYSPFSHNENYWVEEFLQLFVLLAGNVMYLMFAQRIILIENCIPYSSQPSQSADSCSNFSVMGKSEFPVLCKLTCLELTNWGSHCMTKKFCSPCSPGWGGGITLTTRWQALLSLMVTCCEAETARIRDNEKNSQSSPMSDLGLSLQKLSKNKEPYNSFEQMVPDFWLKLWILHPF